MSFGIISCGLYMVRRVFVVHTKTRCEYQICKLHSKVTYLSCLIAFVSFRIDREAFDRAQIKLFVVDGSQKESIEVHNDNCFHCYTVFLYIIMFIHCDRMPTLCLALSPHQLSNLPLPPAAIAPVLIRNTTILKRKQTKRTPKPRRCYSFTTKWI